MGRGDFLGAWRQWRAGRGWLWPGRSCFIMLDAFLMLFNLSFLHQSFQGGLRRATHSLSAWQGNGQGACPWGQQTNLRLGGHGSHGIELFLLGLLQSVGQRAHELAGDSGEAFVCEAVSGGRDALLAEGFCDDAADLRGVFGTFTGRSQGRRAARVDD